MQTRQYGYFRNSLFDVDGVREAFRRTWQRAGYSGRLDPKGWHGRCTAASNSAMNKCGNNSANLPTQYYSSNKATLHDEVE